MGMKDRDKIRVILLENTLTQVWLINKLEERGIMTDKTELSSALSGARKGAKIEQIITASLQILEDYVAKFK